MMRLKYLFDNRDLVLTILENWEYDRSKLDLLDRYRISANAVYPFISNDGVCILRFSPAEERMTDTILAELEFLRFLRGNGYNVPDTVLSKNGKELEYIDTPWGSYLAVVFRRVPGRPLDGIELTGEIVHGYGKALGELHELCRKYSPSEYRRVSWREQMDWMDEILAGFHDEIAAKEEVKILRDFLSGLPATRYNYGLVHYDFELDNVFYDRNDGSFHVIDFDDAVYHWYVTDIDQAIDGLIRDTPLDYHDRFKNEFVAGYRSVSAVEDSMLALLPVFRRYVNLYGYIRILLSTAEKLDNEPDWMTDLRKRLEDTMVNKSINFCKPLPDIDKQILIDRR